MQWLRIVKYLNSHPDNWVHYYKFCGNRNDQSLECWQ
uniref:Uncharacterized protein n=1 Tax=Rhizophora mucronata TaxID=61149 RepID=A0A2P2PKB6_RHIMU